MDYNDNGYLVTIVDKESKLGFTTNKRLLVLRDGCLYYYSKVPKELNKFEAPNIKTLKMNDWPKSAIDSTYIHQVRSDYRNSKVFEIEFEASHLMETEDIRNSMMVEEYNFQPRNSTQIIKWRFTCYTSEIRNLWVRNLNKTIKESLDIQKFVKEYSGEEVSPHKSMRKSLTPWKINEEYERRKEEYQKKIIEFYELLREEERLRTERINREETQRKTEEIVNYQKYSAMDAYNPIESQQNTYNHRESEPSSHLPDSLHNLLKDTDSETGLDTYQMIVYPHDQTKDETQKHYYKGFLTYRHEIPYELEYPIILNEYYSLTDCLFQGSFRQKIDKQLAYRQYQLRFQQEAYQTFEEIVNYITSNHQNKTYCMNGDTKSLNAGRIHFKFAFVQSKHRNNHSVFDCSAVRQIKAEFNAYCKIDETIMRMLKKGNPTMMRVPLVCLLYYRGILALAMMINQEEKEHQLSDSTIVDDYANSYRTLQLNRRWSIIYIDKPKKLPRDKMYKNVAIYTLRIMRNNNASISLTQLKMYRYKKLSEPLTQINRYQVEFIDECILSKHLRTIYRSGQGELDDLDFWSLVFNNDQSIMQMLKELGCYYIPEIKCSILSVLRHYFGCLFEFENINELKTVKKVRYRPFSKLLSGSSLYLTYIAYNFYKFLKENKIDLAKESMTIRQHLGESEYDYLYDCARLHFAYFDNIYSIKTSNRLLELMPPYEIKRLNVYSLLMKNYLYAAPNETNKVFKEVVDLTILLYNYYHSLLVSTYCLMAHALCSMTEYKMAVSILKEALKLAEKAYGSGSKEQREILLDMVNNLMLMGDFSKAEEVLAFVNLPSVDCLEGYKLHIFRLKLMIMRKELKEAKEYLFKVAESLRFSTLNIDNQIIIYRNIIDIYEILQLKQYKRELIDGIFRDGVKSSVKLIRFAISNCFKDFLKSAPKSIVDSIRTSSHSENIEICAEQLAEYYKGFRDVSYMVEHVLLNVVRQKNRQYVYVRSLVSPEYLDYLLENYYI